VSIINCISGKVSKEILDDLTRQYDDILNELAGDTLAADAELVRRVSADKATVRKSRILNAIKSKAIHEEANELFKQEQANWDKMGPIKQKVLRAAFQKPSWHKAYRRVALERADNVSDGYMQHYTTMMPTFMRVIRERGRDREANEVILRGLVEGPDVTNDNTLREAISEIRKFLKWEAAEFHRRGILVGDTGDDYVPVYHNPEVVTKMGEQEWLNWISQRSDESRTYDLKKYKKGVSASRLREIYQQAYDTMENGAAAEARRTLERGGVAGPRVPGHTDLFARKQTYKIFHPRTGQDYVDVMAENVGLENGMSALVNHMQVTARDMAIADIMGPRPTSMHAHMRTVATREGASAQQLQVLDGEFRTLMNQWTGSSDNAVLKTALTVQKLQSGALLGGAGLATLSDQAFVGNTKRLFRMLDADGRTTAWLNSLTQKEALEAVHMTEAFARNNINRFDVGAGEGLEQGFQQGITRAKNFVHSASGLTYMTEKAGDQISLITSGYLGSLLRRGADWGELKSMDPMLRRAGLNSKDWGRLLERGVMDERGFLLVDALPDDMMDVGVKLRSLNSAMRRYATNAPDLTMKAWSSGRVFGDRARGDLMHVAASSVAQFKSFPVMVWRNHFLPSMMKIAQEGAFSPYGMSFAVTSMEALMLGALVVQLKQLSQGKPTMENSPELWVRAGLQGGFYGLVGDVVLKDPNGYGRNLIAEMAGPVPNTTADVAMWLTKTGWSMLDGDPSTDIDTQAFTRALKSFVPGSTIWYTRAATDRMIWDSLNIAMDPEYYETMQRQRDRQISEQGRLGWWAPGMSPNIGR
jgi:hypothetical protein